MKKILLIFLIILVMSILFTGIVGASVTVQDKYNATERMVNLEIVQGFPDGSLGIEQSITRAQFAKIAMTLKGFDEVDALNESYTSFRDVTKGQWFTGWINLAYKHEIIIGDPSGLFRPNDTISYQEATTVILRILGYDNLPYHWPNNYLEKGEEIGLTDGLFERADLAAPRGDVFVMLNRAIDKEIVAWNTKEAKFLPNEDKDTLLITMLEDKKSITGRVIKNYRTENSYNRNEIWIEAEDQGVSGKYILRTNDDVDNLLGLEVRIRQDNGLVFYLDVITKPEQIKNSTVSQFREAVENRPADIQFKGDRARYIFDDKSVTFINFSEDSFKNTNYYGKFVFKENKIAFASVYEFIPELEGSIVKDSSSRSLTIWNADGIEQTLDFKDYRNVYTVDIDFKDISMDIVKTDKIIYPFKNRNNELFLIVNGDVRTGKLTTTATGSITVNGSDYTVHPKNYTTFSTDSDSTIYWYKSDDNKLSGLKNKEVKLLLDKDGEIRHLRNMVTEKGEAQYGILIDAYGSDFINHRIFRIYTDKGTTSSYTVESQTEWHIFGSSTGYFKFDSDNRNKLYIPIKYELNDSGEIKEGSLRVILGPDEIYNYNGFNLSGRGAKLLTEDSIYNLKNMDFGGEFNYIQEGSRKFFINSNTIIMKYEKNEDGSHHKETLLTWDNIRNKVSTGSQAYVVGTPGGDARFVVFHTDFQELIGQPYYGIVVENPISRGDQWIAKLNVADEGIMEYIVEKRTTLQQGDLVKFKAYSNGEIDILNRYSSGENTKYRDAFKTVGSKDGNFIELEPTAEGGTTFWYEFTDDALIFDYDNYRYTTSLKRSVIKEKDRVIVLEENKVIKVILKVNHIR